MTEQQQREACAQLARRMGITIEKRWQHVTDSSWCLYDVRLPGGTYLGAHCGSIEEAHALLPDYFTDPAASRKLIAWLCANDYKSTFGDELLKALGIRDKFLGDIFPAEFHIADILNTPPSVIARAACKALGIEVED